LSNSDWKTIEINLVLFMLSFFETTITLGSSGKKIIIKKTKGMVYSKIYLGTNTSNLTNSLIGLERDELFTMAEKFFWRLLYWFLRTGLRFEVITVLSFYDTTGHNEHKKRSCTTAAATT
ncbi:hypothetical protein ACJX0J_007856, partial [Zea mays]